MTTSYIRKRKHQPELKSGSTYLVCTGGSSTGTIIDGLYSGGFYTSGTQANSFTISGMVTMIGSSSAGMPEGGGFLCGGRR